jgi:hypothetical protein
MEGTRKVQERYGAMFVTRWAQFQGLSVQVSHFIYIPDGDRVGDRKAGAEGDSQII